MLTIAVDPSGPDPVALQPAAEVLRRGGLVAFPTETVYGLGALALDPSAVQRIFDAKGRPSDDPVIVHVRPEWDLGLLFAEVTDTIRHLAAAHWPGPLTIVATKHASVPAVVTSGLSTVAVRAPSHPVAATLLDLVGAPIAAPSANRFSYVSPTTAAHVAADLGEVIDVLVDGGSTPIGIESTIVLVEGDRLSLLRPGSIDVSDAADGEVLPESLSPGRSAVHYSPKTPTRSLTAGAVLAGVDSGGILIGYDDSHAPPAGWEALSLGDRKDLTAVARAFYGLLRIADSRAPAMIVVELTGEDALGKAIDDRIRRASGGQNAY